MDDQVKIEARDITTVTAQMPREDFLKATTLRQFHFDEKCKGLTLSAREIQIIEHLLEGMTSEEIGETIFLSSRTVEDYLSQLREKFNVKSKSKLIRKLRESEFHAYIPQK